MSYVSDVSPILIRNRRLQAVILIGTVISADTQTVSDVHTKNSRNSVVVSTDTYRTTSVWLRMQNGSEVELPPYPNSVTARSGHKIAVVGISNDRGFVVKDIFRVNLTTQAFSERKAFNPLSHAKNLFGCRPHFGDTLLMAIAAGFGAIYAWSFHGEINPLMSWFGNHVGMTFFGTWGLAAVLLNIPVVTATIKLNKYLGRAVQALLAEKTNATPVYGLD